MQCNVTIVIQTGVYQIRNAFGDDAGRIAGVLTDRSFRSATGGNAPPLARFERFIRYEE